jgi:nuclear RNA export factor
MKDDEILRKNNLEPPGAGGSARVAAVIFKLASQLKPPVRLHQCSRPLWLIKRNDLGANDISG